MSKNHEKHLFLGVFSFGVFCLTMFILNIHLLLCFAIFLFVFFPLLDFSAQCCLCKINSRPICNLLKPFCYVRHKSTCNYCNKRHKYCPYFILTCADPLAIPEVIPALTLAAAQLLKKPSPITCDEVQKQAQQRSNF